jgi:hypothetical protein
MENGQLISVMPLDANEAAKLEEIRMMKEKFSHGGH